MRLLNSVQGEEVTIGFEGDFSNRGLALTIVFVTFLNTAESYSLVKPLDTTGSCSHVSVELIEDYSI